MNSVLDGEHMGSPLPKEPEELFTVGQKYDIQMERYDNSLNAVAQLGRGSAPAPKQIIPQAQFYLQLYS